MVMGYKSILYIFYIILYKYINHNITYYDVNLVPILNSREVGNPTSSWYKTLE